LFKLGNAFFDFTPFKLVSNLWPTNITNLENPLATHTQYNFTWCQLISETTNVTSGQELACTGNMFAGSADVTFNPLNPNDYTVGSCTPLTGEKGRDNIEANTI